MSDELTLEDVDVDGAIRETAAEAVETLEAEGDTRASFLKRAGLAGGAFMGGGALLGALAPSALAFDVGAPPPSKIFGKGDFAILNYALVLEYLERDFYDGALAHQRSTGFLTNAGTLGSQLLTFLEIVDKDETAHVSLLRTALGQKQIHEPKFNFHGDNQTLSSFQKAAFALENTGVQAYLGQAFNLSSPMLKNVANTIVTVEARHAGVIGLLYKATPANPSPIAPSGPRDNPAGATEVLNKVKKTGYITKLYKAPGHT